MGEGVAPGAARQMAQPAPGSAQRQSCKAATIGEIGQYAEHRPDRERHSRQGCRGCGAGEEEDDHGREECANKGR